MQTGALIKTMGACALSVAAPAKIASERGSTSLNFIINLLLGAALAFPTRFFIERAVPPYRRALVARRAADAPCLCGGSDLSTAKAERHPAYAGGAKVC